LILHGVLTKNHKNSTTNPRGELDVPIPKLLVARRLIMLD